MPRFITDEPQLLDMAAGASPESGDETLATSIGQYVLGEISLGKAAENVGMTRWEFEELLEESGFTALYGPRSEDAVRDELDAALDLE